jgi:hypothetical protein
MATTTYGCPSPRCKQSRQQLLLNLFAATGRNNYARGGLQLMISLPDSHPSLYKLFAEEGFHVIRRSD